MTVHWKTKQMVNIVINGLYCDRVELGGSYPDVVKDGLSVVIGWVKPEVVVVFSTYFNVVKVAKFSSDGITTNIKGFEKTDNLN